MASERFVEEWLNHSSNMSTIVNMIMSDTSTNVIDNLCTNCISYKCLQ